MSDKDKKIDTPLLRKVKTCKVCNTKLSGRQEKFCSKSCKSINRSLKPCVVCGELQTKKYCSKECNKKSRRKDFK